MNKVIVVTGTATGLGKATVDKFATAGWNVVATVRKEADLAVHQGHPQVRTLVLDVDDEQAAPDFARQALAQFGRVDAMVNNAGSYQMGPVESTSMDQVHRQFQTNVFGLIAITRAFLPHFRTQRSGVIVNISSLTAEQGYPYNAVYAASKAAVATFSEGLSMEMAEFGVVVRSIMPGQHATKIFTKIDAASDIAEDYQAGIGSFFAATPMTGSSPGVTADVIYQAVLDPQVTRVRYYSGPDSAAIPAAKRILGPQQYWEEFREAVAGRVRCGARLDHHSALVIVRTEQMKRLHHNMHRRMRTNARQAPGGRRGIVLDGPPQSANPPWSRSSPPTSNTGSAVSILNTSPRR